MRRRANGTWRPVLIAAATSLISAIFVGYSRARDRVKAMPVSFGYRLAGPQDQADLLAWMTALDDPEFEHK